MRWTSEILLFVVIGAFLGATGPYGTAGEPFPARLAFWLALILAGGCLGVAIETLLRPRLRAAAVRLLVTSLAMTPPIAVLVVMAMAVVFGHRHPLVPGFLLPLLWQVLVISLAVMGVRQLVHRPPERIVETRTIVAPPLPDAEAAFRARLSARRRAARLLALEAHDHFVRVHTDAGDELVSIRFSDAVAELDGAHGFRVHRSWWVAADAIRAARWRRGSGEVELENGLAVPVSRSGAPLLRAAGWL